MKQVPPAPTIHKQLLVIPSRIYWDLAATYKPIRGHVFKGQPVKAYFR